MTSICDLFPGTFTSTEEAYRFIDKAISEHNASILSSRTERNAYSPLYSLPPEIFSNILSEVADETPSRTLFELVHLSHQSLFVAIDSPILRSKLPTRTIASNNVRATTDRRKIYGSLRAVKNRAARDKKRRSIDESIGSHQATIFDLKRQRNACATVFRIPPEILCEIFAFLQAEEEEEERENSENNDALMETPCNFTWVKLTYVCHRWREVGIEYSNLWTTPPLACSSWTRCMLQRSKSAPLNLIASPIRSSHIRGLELLSLPQHAERIGELAIKIPRHEDKGQWAKLIGILPKSAPQMKRLDLLNLDTRKVFSFGDEVLSNTPSLEHLGLSDFTIDWTSHSNFLCGLTSLCLVNIVHTNLTWKKFAEAWKRMPNLENVQIGCAFPMGLDEKISWEPAYLSSLQYLWVSCQVQEAMMFLSCVDFPPTAWVNCNLSPSTNPDEDDICSVFKRLGRVYSSLPDTDESFQSMTMQWKEFPRVKLLTLKLHTELLEEGEILQACRSRHEIMAHLEITFPCERDPATPSSLSARLITGIFNCGLPLQDVARVCLRSPRKFLQPELFLETFGKLKNVQVFMAFGRTAKILIDALRYYFVDPYFSGKPLPFPELSHIYVVHARLVHGDKTYPRFMESLEDVLNHRQRLGAGLSHVVLYKSFGAVRVPDMYQLANFVKGGVVCLRQLIEDDKGQLKNSPAINVAVYSH